MPTFRNTFRQRGGTLVGFVLGLVLGLAIAVAVALYITNAPVPFVNKVKPAAEAVNPAGAGGQVPDPNKPLYMPPPKALDAPRAEVPAAAPPAESRADPKAAPPPPEKGAATASTAPPTEGTRYLLQAGAFRLAEDADAMRARLVLLGFDARITPREQDGTTLYRVRLGPYGNVEDLNRIRKTLAENGIDAQLVKVQ